MEKRSSSALVPQSLLGFIILGMLGYPPFQDQPIPVTPYTAHCCECRWVTNMECHNIKARPILALGYVVPLPWENMVNGPYQIPCTTLLWPGWQRKTGRRSKSRACRLKWGEVAGIWKSCTWKPEIVTNASLGKTGSSTNGFCLRGDM